VLFPFLWGGTREDGKEESFAFFPFYADLKQWLFYERFQSVLFPLWVRTTNREVEKTNTLLWPLISWGGSGDPNGPRWWRVLPFYGQDIRPGRYEYYSVLWPFIHWSVDALETADPVHSFLVFPFYGKQWSDKGDVSSWAVLWPFFRGTTIEGRT